MVVINNNANVEKVFHVFIKHKHYAIIYKGYLTADNEGTNPRRFYLYDVQGSESMGMNKANPEFGYAISTNSPSIGVENLAWDKNGNPNIVAVQPFQ